MDTLAHGLWGGAAFGQCDKHQWKWAFLLGMGPDLLSFGPFFLTRLGTIAERWGQHRMEPPDPRIIPAYVYHAYNVTHSLVVWAAAFAVIWGVTEYRSNRVTPRPPVTPLQKLLPLLAWPLHILCDIPTHSTRFFPTPYLWPLPTPYVNGTPWGNKIFMISNYAAIALTYLVLQIWKSKKPSA